MLEKVLAFIQVWIGLTFVTILIAYIPGVGASIAGFINQLLGFFAQIPYYNLILGIMGTVLFAHGAYALYRGY